MNNVGKDRDNKSVQKKIKEVLKAPKNDSRRN